MYAHIFEVPVLVWLGLTLSWWRETQLETVITTTSPREDTSDTRLKTIEVMVMLQVTSTGRERERRLTQVQVLWVILDARASSSSPPKATLESGEEQHLEGFFFDVLVLDVFSFVFDCF